MTKHVKYFLLSILITAGSFQTTQSMTLIVGTAVAVSAPFLTIIGVQNFFWGKKIDLLREEVGEFRSETTNNFTQVRADVKTANDTLDTLTQIVTANHTASQDSHTTTQKKVGELTDKLTKHVEKDFFDFSSATTVTLADMTEKINASASYLDMFRKTLLPQMNENIESTNKKSDDILLQLIQFSDRLKTIEEALPSLATKDDLSQLVSKISKQVSKSVSEQITPVLTKLDQQAADAQQAFAKITNLNAATVAGIFAMNSSSKKPILLTDGSI